MHLMARNAFRPHNDPITRPNSRAVLMHLMARNAFRLGEKRRTSARLEVLMHLMARNAFRLVRK